MASAATGPASGPESDAKPPPSSLPVATSANLDARAYSSGTDFELQLTMSVPLPIPVPPGLLKAYEDICPGITKDFILPTARAEQAHRHAMETKVSGRRTWGLIGGLACGLVVTIAALIVGGVVAAAGHPATGIAISGSQIVLVVTVFVLRRLPFMKEPPESSEADEDPASAP